ncbi:MAG: hypothetical protein DWQ53_18915 [Microcystis flos-aquae DF17]|jgi:hypothetical protein|nr:MAG: hypothetical protein DWQ53_18915 [Microcystis flos-aquae DF17]
MNDIIGAWGVALSFKSLLPVEYNDLRFFVKSNLRDFAPVNISFSQNSILNDVDVYYRGISKFNLGDKQGAIA